MTGIYRRPWVRKTKGSWVDPSPLNSLWWNWCPSQACWCWRPLRWASRGYVAAQCLPLHSCTRWGKACLLPLLWRKDTWVSHFTGVAASIATALAQHTTVNIGFISQLWVGKDLTCCGKATLLPIWKAVRRRKKSSLLWYCAHCKSSSDIQEHQHYKDVIRENAMVSNKSWQCSFSSRNENLTACVNTEFRIPMAKAVSQGTALSCKAISCLQHNPLHKASATSAE